MTILAFLLSVATVVLLHKKLVSKNPKKAHRICLTGANILFSIFFITFIAVINMVRDKADTYIDQHINSLEKKVDEIHPGALTEQMSPVDAKKILVKAFEKDQNHSVDEIAGNIAKTFMENYTLAVLKAIQSLERTNDNISVKEAILSVKEIALHETMPYFGLLNMALFFSYLVYIVIFVAFVRILNNAQNEGLFFGKDADRTPLEMTTKE